MFEWRSGYQAEDEELDRWAEHAELQKEPKPDYFTDHEMAPYWPTVVFIALFAGLGYLFWSRI